MTITAARLQNFGPNWFASVMGTGIVATAGATLPIHVPGLHVFSTVVWVAAAVLLVVLVVAVTVQWFRHPTVARAHSRNPQMAHFYGAAPMALMTVGSGAILVGKDLIGARVAVDLDWVLWTAGTVGGLFTAATIPFLMFTQLNVEPDAAFGGWLMPVVPPMVSAAAGALLIPHHAARHGTHHDAVRLLRDVRAVTVRGADHHHHDLEQAGPLRHVRHGAGADAVDRAGPARPGHHRGRSARDGRGARRACRTGQRDERLRGAVRRPVWGFAVLWIVLATELTVRTLRRGMPFALTWWSLTFPVGTFVTGTTQLAVHTGLPAFEVAAAIAYAGLLGTWGLVAVRTARGSLRGNLFAPPPSAGPIKAKKDPPVA